MPLTLIDCVDKELWNRFVEESPHGSVFCSTPFLDALAEEYCLVFAAEGDELLAGAVLILRDGQPYPGPYPLTMYQGVLLGATLCWQPPHSRPQRTLEVLEFLLAELERRYERVVFCQHHAFEDLRGFSWFHYHERHCGQFHLELQYTGLLELANVADFEQYLASIRTVRRQEYRRCQAKGFRVRASDDLDLLDRLHEMTFARQGIVREADEVRLLRAISQAALERGFGEFRTCIAPDGTVASATLFLFDQRCAFYWVAANDPAFRKEGCGTYLMIENIRRWQEMGRTTIDFVGINSPQRGEFKTSFNAVPRAYFQASWEKSPTSHPGHWRVDRALRGYPDDHQRAGQQRAPSGPGSRSIF
jgi:hypothetical protein